MAKIPKFVPISILLIQTMSLLQSSAINIDPEELARVNDSIKAVTNGAIEQLKSNPQEFLQDLLQTAIDFGLKLLAAILIYCLGAWIISRIKKALTRVFAKRKTEGTLASFITSFVSISLTVILIIIAISTLGINTTSIAALLAAGGMAIGMALSGTISNFAGGIMLLAFKPFKAGDFISAQGYSGRVKDVTIVNTKILTIDNRLVIIPNGALFNGNIDNYSAMQLRRIDMTINLEYGTDADKCIKTITDILKTEKRILDSKTPGVADPFVVLSSLNESDITFTIRAWVNATDYWDVRFLMNKTLYTRLPKMGFSFTYPHMDVTIKN